MTKAAFGLQSVSESRLIVRTGQSRFAIPLARVREITRVPKVTPVPLSPQLLRGLGNVRGETLAIISLTCSGDEPISAERQLVILEGPDRIGLAVDSVERIERRGRKGTRRAKVEELQLDHWIADAFPVRQRSLRSAGERDRAAGRREADERVPLLRFALAGQSFALPLDQVTEVIRPPATVTPLPGADDAVVGTFLWRGRTLGLLLPHLLLGLSEVRVAGRAERVILVSIGGHQFGMLVDRLEGLLKITADRIDPVPPALQLGEQEARIAALCRPDRGGLVSVLAADHLLGEARRRSMPTRAAPLKTSEFVRSETMALLRFAIGGHALALPLEAVEQVVSRPQHVTPVPGAPDWLLGVTRLAGAMVPIIDQVRRLTGHAAHGSRQRLLLVRAAGERAGFLVDDARTIVHADRADLAPAPLPDSLADGIFDEALTLDDEQKTLILLDPAALISSAEKALLESLGTGKRVKSA